MGRTCGTHRTQKKIIQRFNGEICGKNAVWKTRAYVEE